MNKKKKMPSNLLSLIQTDGKYYMINTITVLLVSIFQIIKGYGGQIM